MKFDELKDVYFVVEVFCRFVYLNLDLVVAFYIIDNWMSGNCGPQVAQVEQVAQIAAVGFLNEEAEKNCRVEIPSLIC